MTFDKAIHARFQVTWPGFNLDVELRLPGRGVAAFQFGHSGSGKTTLLRCLAGLERQSVGSLNFKGEVWRDDARHCRPTYRRPLGYVFQEASLFPHLSVRKNLDYGRKRVNGGHKVSLDHAVELLGVDTCSTGCPDRLFRGERQRVAIARALATQPGTVADGRTAGGVWI